MLKGIKKTKIVCTLGPASQSEETLTQLVENGLNVCRFNFSHGSHEEHKERFDTAKKVREKLNKPIAILLDTKGPEIRTGNFDAPEVLLEEGQKFIITMKDVMGTKDICTVSYKGLAEDVTTGDTILIDDGLVGLRVEEVKGEEIHCVVENSGIVKNHKGVNVPRVKINLPALTEKDVSDIEFGIGQGIDYIAASFVRKASDVLAIREVLEKNNSTDVQIISKIENQEGVDNIDEILKVSDGIMVARGDLGVEIPTEEIPIVQKMIIRKCNQLGKPVVTATQMLDSMIRNPRPTRAEASDVCNAIFDGTDAIMLSGESASGSFPIEAAMTMSRIAKKAEANLDYNYLLRRLKDPNPNPDAFADAISYSASKTASKFPTKAIVAATQTGSTAKILSKYKPSCPIIAITPYEKVRRSLALNFGIISKKCAYFNSTDEIIEEARKVAKEFEIAETGDNIMVAAGFPTSITGGTNMLKIEKI